MISTRWTTAAIEDPPHGAGVYAISSRGRILYVGSALNIRFRIQDYGYGRRWKRHTGKFGRSCDLELRIARCRRASDRLSREARLIDRLRPPFNSTGTGARKRQQQTHEQQQQQTQHTRT